MKTKVLAAEPFNMFKSRLKIHLFNYKWILLLSIFLVVFMFLRIQHENKLGDPP